MRASSHSHLAVENTRRSIFDIRDAVSVSGINGVTIPWHQPRRESDTQITIELEFDGNMNTDGTLTFTVGADAIANYNGSALTAQVTVTADRENVLLANFPNPFNPETWIPYQLAKDAEVTLHYLFCEWHIGADVDPRSSSRGSVSKPFPCCVLGWQKRVR